MRENHNPKLKQLLNLLPGMTSREVDQMIEMALVLYKLRDPQ